MTRSIIIKSAPPDLDAAALDALTATSSALLADAHRDVACLGTPIGPLGGRTVFIGSAVTIGAGSMAQWKALDLAVPGQVLVIATGGRRDRAEFGAIFVELAMRKGVAAIVTDGLLRDGEEIGQLDMPVFACGSHPSSPRDDTPGRIGATETLQQTAISSGDILVGDKDGIAVVPRAALPAVLERLLAQRQHEAGLAASLSGHEALLPVRVSEAIAAIPIISA
jgi:4-hydroxy-4-methyl-2-oxoglutarate aldolase